MAEVRHNIQELNQLFLDGESADKDLFAEQRSNVQLILGDHYSKKGQKFWQRLNDQREMSADQKIRLTKNHIRKIVNTYKNSITQFAPGVQASAKDKASMQHQKSAELVNSVWADGKGRHDFNQKINQWASDFVGIGEVAVKVFFDPNAGKYLGQQAKVDQFGQVVLDEMGQPIPDGAKFTGDTLIERLFAFNIIRPAACKDIEKAEWLCHRKMVLTADARDLVDSAQLSDDEKEKLKAKIADSPDQTYTVLDGNTGSYKQEKGQTMLKEWFFRPCPRYPRGYFYICVESAILFEGELPFGIFPIVFKGFDEIQTSPRARAIVKQIRPYQVEINRCASKMAEHQITLGDDKLLVLNGTKLAPGVALPGVRSIQYSGPEPKVLAGRTGDQYLNYMQSQITEMYQVAQVDEITEEKQEQFDVYSMLYRSIKNKKKFSYYTDAFESFLKNVFQTYIAICQNYYNDQNLIPAIGKSEYINISEFKACGDLSYIVQLEAQTDDSESKLGKQLALQHIIQYVGPQLEKKDLGKIIRLMPYANDEQILEDLTMNYDFANNLLLGLDRGKPAVENPNTPDAAYIIDKLVNRTVKPDFEFLSPQIKQLYQQAIQAYMNIKTDQEVKIKQAQSEFIPTGGFLVACDFYIPDPANPQKLPKRVRIPSESIDWLLKQMSSQGSDQQTLEEIGNKGAVAQMSNMFLNKTGSQPSMGLPQHQQQMPQQNPGANWMSQQRPMMPQQNGPTSPGGTQHGY